MVFIFILILGILLFITLFFIDMLWGLGWKKPDFLVEEANRYSNGYFEKIEGWNNHNRLYTEGIIVIKNKKTGEKKIINQAKLCDIGILR